MEAIFQQTVDNLKGFCSFSAEDMKILEAADKAADEMALSEFEHYIKHEVNMESHEIAKKYGLLGIPIKKEYGGSGARHIVSVLAKERLGQLGGGFSSFTNVQTFLGALTLQRWGSDMQKKKYLKPAAKGEKVLAFGLTEPEAGSDPSSMKTQYESSGNKYLLNGTKYLITNGTIADHVIVFARSKERPAVISAFIVEGKSLGLSRTQLKEKIGLFTSDTGMLEFKDVEVPEENVLGGIGEGMHVAHSALLNGRLGVASSSIGIIGGCLKASVDRARTRVQHGKLIGKHQLIQKHIAEIRQNLEMARWPTYFAAMKREDYDKDPDNIELRDDMELRTSLAKKIAARLSFESADRAVQIFGGFGYSLLSPVGCLFLDSRVTRIYEGTDEIQELKIAAGVLGKGFEAFR